MRVGFTGSRRGMTQTQRHALRVLLPTLHPTELHHGDCLGSDAEAHDIATALGIRVVSHPPDNPKARAFCAAALELEPLPYLDRNRQIVDMTDILFAAVDGPERQRSGTWMTVRYALSQGKRVLVEYPYGTTR